MKMEHVEERAAGHSELRTYVDEKVKAAVRAAVKEALAQVADALECACCFEHVSESPQERHARAHGLPTLGACRHQ